MTRKDAVMPRIFFVLVFFIFVLVASESYASIEYTVKEGDTLSGIANKYRVSVQAIQDENGILSKRLRPGEKITIRSNKKIKKISMKKGKHPVREEEISSADTSTAVADAQNQTAAKKLDEEIKDVSESEEFETADSPNKLIAFARKLINIPYKFGGNSIFGIDCSAYVKKVYGLLGIELPRTAREQFNTGETIEKDQLSIGDLVFFRTYASFPSHVGIYLGNNLFIHASSRGKKVTIDSLDTPYYLKRFIGGKRLLTEGELEKDQQG
jgi:peptidoglycan endopeptidase LytE